MAIEYEGIWYSNKDDLPIPPDSWVGRHLKKWFCGMAVMKVIIALGGKATKELMQSSEGPLYKELEPLLTTRYTADTSPRKSKPHSKWFDLADWATTYRGKEGRFEKDGKGIWSITEKGREYYQQYENIYESRYALLLGDESKFQSLLNPEKPKKEVCPEEIKPKTKEEKECTLSLMGKEGGIIEVPVSSPVGFLGYADLVTPSEVIEVKNEQNWKHAVGQILAYYPGLRHLGLKPRIHLFGGRGSKLNEARKKIKWVSESNNTTAIRVTFEKR